MSLSTACQPYKDDGLATINKLSHRSSKQTEKPQPEDKRIMPDTRFTEFLALSVDPKAGLKYYWKIEALTLILTITLYDSQLQTSFGV